MFYSNFKDVNDVKSILQRLNIRHSGTDNEEEGGKAFDFVCTHQYLTNGPKPQLKALSKGQITRINATSTKRDALHKEAESGVFMSLLVQLEYIRILQPLEISTVCCPLCYCYFGEPATGVGVNKWQTVRGYYESTTPAQDMPCSGDRLEMCGHRILFVLWYCVACLSRNLNPM